MHQRLKFSFGHILAFLALLFIGYVTFMSATYYSGGKYIAGAVAAAAIMVTLLLMLFRLQLLKGVNQNFETNILRERAMLVVMTLTCAVAFVPYSHFWTVRHNEKQISSIFNNSLDALCDLFYSYDDYTNGRINILDANLSAQMLTSADTLRRIVATKGLVLQLRPAHYASLRQAAVEWVSFSKRYVTVWNVFLMGNIDAIENSLSDWHGALQRQSSHIAKGELASTQPFDCSDTVAEVALKLKAVVPFYTTFTKPQPMAWATGFLAFLMLFAPWMVQKRSPKSLVTLFGRRKEERGRVLGLNEERRVKVRHRAGSLDNASTSEATTETTSAPRRRHRAQTLD